MVSEVYSLRSDARIKQTLVGKDMSGLEELYRSHRKRVYSICLRMLGDASEAEDLTHEVFMQLARKLDSFRGESEFTTWLHRLTVNQVLMYMRRQRAKKRADEIWVMSLSSGGRREQEDDTSSEEDVEKMRVLKFGESEQTFTSRIALDRAIRELPPGYRAVLMLHDIEGYQHEEIADMLGCGLGTSKSQLHKARRALRGLLLEEIGPSQISYELDGIVVAGVDLPGLKIDQILEMADEAAELEED